MINPKGAKKVAKGQIINIDDEEDDDDDYDARTPNVIAEVDAGIDTKSRGLQKKGTKI